MDQRRNYRVADWAFAMTLPDEWQDRLFNYEPFLSGDEGNDAVLFHLSAVNQLPTTHAEMDHVFTDSSDEDMPRIEVYRKMEGNKVISWLFRVSMTREGAVASEIWTTGDFHEAQLLLHTADYRFGVDNAAMLLYAFTTAHRHTLEMHASVTVRHDIGYLFLGKSGTGKSTHSMMWMEAFQDARLLNDDNPILRLLDDGSMRVYGSPWSGKTACYINRSVPVGGIVKLTQAPHNEIRPLRLPEAYAYMLSSASGLKVIPEMMDALYDTISAMIQTIRVYGLECLPNTEAAEVCYNAVSKL